MDVSDDEGIEIAPTSAGFIPLPPRITRDDEPLPQLPNTRPLNRSNPVRSGDSGYSSVSRTTSESQNYNRTGQDGRRYTESTSRPRGFDGRSHGYGDDRGSSTPYGARTFTSDPIGPIPELRESHVRRGERS